MNVKWRRGIFIMNEITMGNIWLIVVVMSILLLLFIIIILLQMLKLQKFRKKYKNTTSGKETRHLEYDISNLTEDVTELKKIVSQHYTEVEQIKQTVKKMNGYVTIQRYNAFVEQGGNLSFSVAWLNEEQDGFVMTSIHGRDHCYVYAKPIEKGQSKYPLSTEEKSVIQHTNYANV